MEYFDDYYPETEDDDAYFEYEDEDYEYGPVVPQFA